MEPNPSMVSIVSFNVYINALTGLLGVSAEKLKPFSKGVMRRVPKYLERVAYVSNTVVVIFTVISVVRLASPGVPMAERCFTFLTTGTYLQSLAKIVYFYARREKFQLFSDKWDESFADPPHREVEQHMHSVERRKVKVITISLLLMISSTAVTWCYLPIFQVFQDIHGGRYLNVPIWVPGIDILQPINNEIALVATAISSFFTTTKTIAYDGFFFSLVSLLVVKLQHLKFTMTKVFEEDVELTEIRAVMHADSVDGEDLESTTSTDLDKKQQFLQSFDQKGRVALLEMKEDGEAIQRLSKWVEHHQQTMDLGEQLTDLYSPMIMAQFVTNTVILCFTAFIMTSVHLDFMQYVLTTVYTFGNIFQLYLMCHYGDRLAEASVSLSETCFLSGWHKRLVGRVRSSLLIILQRVQKPLSFSFYGLYPLNAVTFVDVIQGSISYLMILFNITEEN